MKRKRPARHDQSLKEQENSSSTKSFRSNITGKLQTLLNGFVSELQSISEDKRQDVTLLFSPQYKEANDTDDSSTIKSAFPSLANSPDSTKVLQNFIDSAKSRISGLLSNKQESQISCGNNLLKNFQSSVQPKTKSLSIDPLEIQINLKFQSLLFKAFDTKKTNHVNDKQEITTSESIITDKDWQDLSRMLQDFSESARRKLHTSLTRERNSQFLNGSVGVQNSPVKESQSSNNTQQSLVSQRISQNKELQESSVNQGNSSCPLGSDSGKLTKKNAKLLKMNFSSESTDNSSSPRNPFDEGCMLLLSDAEKCPKYVDLQFSSESDLDEPEDIEPPNSHVHKSESEDEVIVLGEKSKTYQEVTLEEDDDGQVHESVVEKVVEKCPKKEKGIEELVFNCSKCDKSFRVQSLLQFHIKMHTAENPSSKASEYHCPNSSSSSEDESSSPERPSNLNQRKVDICISQGALVSQKDLGSNDEFSILNLKLSKADDKSLRKVKEASKFSIKCETFASGDSTAHQELSSSNSEKRFLVDVQIKHYPDGRELSGSVKCHDRLNMKHSSNEKSFRKSKAKPSSNCDNFASRDAVVSPPVVSSLCGEGRFLRIEPCPDNPDLSMMFNFESLISEKSPSSMKEEHSYIDEKSFGEYEPSKSSANCENLSSEYATFSQKVSNSSDEEGFLSNDQIEHCPDLSMRYDLVSEKNLNTLKDKHLFSKEERFWKYKVSKPIYNHKNFASDDTVPDQNVSNSRGKAGFLEGRIEPCPENVKFSMLFDWKNLDC